MEIERKFLVASSFNIKDLAYTTCNRIVDQYISNNIRIRNINNKPIWYITVKGKGTVSRYEYEFPILVRPQFNINKYPLLKKVRYIVPYNKQQFEVNIFDDIYYKGSQLILVELELTSKDQQINKPEWLGKEVTNDLTFYGYNLASTLYNRQKK